MPELPSHSHEPSSTCVEEWDSKADEEDNDDDENSGMVALPLPQLRTNKIFVDVQRREVLYSFRL